MSSNKVWWRCLAGHSYDESPWSKAQPRGINRSLPRKKTGLVSSTKKMYIKSTSHCLTPYQRIVDELYTIIFEGKFTQSQIYERVAFIAQKGYGDLKFKVYSLM